MYSLLISWCSGLCANYASFIVDLNYSRLRSVIEAGFFVAAELNVRQTFPFKPPSQHIDDNNEAERWSWGVRWWSAEAVL